MPTSERPAFSTVRTIDAHVAGEPLRLIVDGCPGPSGATMLEKMRWSERHLDSLRRTLMHEPRGHTDMYGAFLTEPVEPGSQAGLLCMHHSGFSPLGGHAVIGAVTIALERGLLQLAPDAEVRLDVPAGTVRATPIWRDADRRQVDRVAYQNVPSFVSSAGLAVKVEGRVLRVDVAYGGAFYAIVDAEVAGVPLRFEYLPELRRLGVAVAQTVESKVSVVHPSQPKLRGIYGTIFTGLPDAEGAHLRSVTVFADGQVDRSPGGSATAALMAVLDAIGLLGPEQPFVPESLIATQLRGTVEDRLEVGDYPAIRARIEGSAWITGEHTFFVDEQDPLPEGFSW